MRHTTTIFNGFAIVLILLCSMVMSSCSYDREEAVKRPADEAHLIGEWYSSDGKKVIFNQDQTGLSDTEQMAFLFGGIEIKDFQWQYEPAIGQIWLKYNSKLMSSQKQYALAIVGDNELIFTDEASQKHILTR